MEPLNPRLVPSEQVPQTPVHTGFSSPDEELAYLRARVAQKERELAVSKDAFEQERIAKREIVEYGTQAPKEVLHETVIIPEHDAMREALQLEKEEHDGQIDGLLKIAAEQGIRNALTVVGKIKDPHIEDDFHRSLVQYIAAGLPIKPGVLPVAQETWRSLHMTLYEIEPSGAREAGDEKQSLDHLLASMEQLYAGMVSIAGKGKKNVFSMEIAVAQGSEDLFFFIAVPRDKRDLFERHVLSVFPNARLTERRGDYNIFDHNGEHAGAAAHLREHPILPIRTYESFQHDPMNIMLSAFAKLAKHGEGAAIQIIVGNEDDRYNKHYRKMVSAMHKGKSFKKALKEPETELGDIAREVGKSLVQAIAPEQENRMPEQNTEHEKLERAQKKIESRIMPTTIRLVTSAKDEGRARLILENLASTFNQFDDSQGNGLVFKEIGSWHLRNFLRGFIMRTPDSSNLVPLNLTELTSLFHLTAEGVSTSRELKKNKAKQAPAPVDMPEDGILLGYNRFGGSETEVRFSPEDRLRHFYIVGQTGTGKSNFLKHMMIQDIRNGEGVCYIDPHGSDIIDVLASVPPERKDDIIYFDPSYTPMPMGLNMLEYDTTRPEQKTFVVDELLGTFKKLYSDVPEAIGPAFEQYFRNATLLVMEDPATGNTMVDITRVFANKQFRDLKLSRCGNPLVTQFFRDIASKTQGEQSFENFAQYVTNKFDVFLANEIMRPIIGQEKSAFNFRDVMDSRKILLVNLSKGMLGDLNAHLIGLIFVGKILLAALGRADSVGKNLPPFYLYLDEFQNITTPSIETIFSEARKYKLALTVAHQYVNQLDEGIRDSVFGNVGSKAVFRVGIEDAQYLERAFEPEFKASDIAGLDNFNAYLSMLVGGKPAKPFSMGTLPLDDIDYERAEEYKALSYQKYGRPREEIEAEIRAKWQSAEPPSLDPSHLQDGTFF